MNQTEFELTLFLLGWREVNQNEELYATSSSVFMQVGKPKEIFIYGTADPKAGIQYKNSEDMKGKEYKTFDKWITALTKKPNHE
jgi:hypothetical protein